jgi:hypothetical protein
MSTGTFVKVPRAFLRGKECKAIGAAWALYLLMFLKADWDDGEIRGWVDRDAAEELGESLHTVRKWRTRLESLELITCVKHSHDLTIRVTRWGETSHIHVGSVTKNGESPKTVSDQNIVRHMVTHHPYSDNAERAALRARGKRTPQAKPFATRRLS